MCLPLSVRSLQRVREKDDQRSGPVINVKLGNVYHGAPGKFSAERRREAHSV